MEELRHILEIYQNGMENRLALIKYMNREKRSIETNSTEAIVNEYLADESYISASKNLTTFFTEYFNDKIDKVKSQKDANDLFQVLANCQTIEKDIRAPGYYYESSFPAINQALTDSQILFVKYCQDHDLQVPGKLKELTSPESNQNREEVTIDISVSDLQLQLLDQEITDLEQKSELNTNDSILLIAKKWIHTSIETQKKYQELFPGYLNRQFAYIRQLETIQQVDADFRPKYEFSKEQHIANIPDYTYITNSNIVFTKGGYHGSIPDNGFLIAKSLNVEFLKSIFGDYAVATLRLGIKAGVLSETDFKKAKEYLNEIKEIVKANELSVISNPKELSEKLDGLPLDSDTINRINQLGNLKISHFIQLRI